MSFHADHVRLVPHNKAQSDGQTADKRSRVLLVSGVPACPADQCRKMAVVSHRMA
jgi:hypothetical protein